MTNGPIRTIDEALESLEPRTASPQFTERVIQAVSDAERAKTERRLPSPGRHWAFAAMAAAAIVVGILLGVQKEPPVGALAATETKELRAQHEELVREVERLRLLADETSPVLYLGSDGELDLVVDLTTLLEPGAPDQTRPLPASYQGSGESF